MAADPAAIAARTALLLEQAQILTDRLQAQVAALRVITEEMRRQHD
jgi:hypothetical protein